MELPPPLRSGGDLHLRECSCQVFSHFRERFCSGGPTRPRTALIASYNERAALGGPSACPAGFIMAFVDRVTLYVQAGDGGSGCCSFRREKYVPRGGPDGGDGGDGGDVIVRASGTDSLAEIVNRKHWRADSGGRGMPDNCHGRKAEDLVIPVPPGTIVRDRDRGHVLRDLTRAGEQVVVAVGGRGGRGNKAFAPRTPRGPRPFRPAAPGDERRNSPGVQGPPDPPQVRTPAPRQPPPPR